MGKYEFIVWGNVFINFSRILGVIRSLGLYVGFILGNFEVVFWYENVV